MQKPSKVVEVKISVYDEEVRIEVQGITQIVKGETKGMGDIIVPSKVLKAYLQTTTTSVISFTFRNGEFECGSSIYNSSAIQVSRSLVKPENDLPINITPISLLRLAAMRSAEEIKEMGLESRYNGARRRLSMKINEAVDVLKDYNVTFDELKAIIDKKLKG
jgi:hypothetical protein